MRPHVRGYFRLYSGENAFLLLTVRKFVRFAAIEENFTVVDQLAGQPLGRLRHRFFTWPLEVNLDVYDAAGKLRIRLVETEGCLRYWLLLIGVTRDFNAQFVTPEGVSIGSLYLERYAQSGEIHMPRSAPAGISPQLLLAAAVISLLQAREAMEDGGE
jgi:hypothetical protein